MPASLLKRLFGLRKAVSDSPSTPSLNEKAILQAANAALRRDDFPAADIDLARLVSAGSKNPAVYESYGYVLLNLERYTEARIVLQSAIVLEPSSADAHYMLGKVCVALDQPEAAEQAWATCYALSQEIEALYCDYCLLLFDGGKTNQAKTLIQSGIERYPNNADLHFFLGNLHSASGDYEASVLAYQKSMALDPSSASLLSNYGNALRHTGNLQLSIELAKRATHLAPEAAHILSNYLFSIQYSSLFTREYKFAAHLEYSKKFEEPLVNRWGNYKNSLASARKIRIGYVSGDFRTHSLVFFIEPILINHDRSRFEVYGYYTFPFFDDATIRIQKLCDKWIPCNDMTDEALATRIRDDQIDILIDLSGHTGYNRLLTFARKPAPIQMTWLGYQSTTGLSAIDYRITEEALDPTGESEAFHSEKLLRLPSSGTFSASPASPPVNPLPALTSAVFTFACLNNPSKITAGCVELWSQILHRAPASRLLIGYATPALVKDLSEQFLLHGIPQRRISFQPKVAMLAYLELHHQVDLALDTFPYNGGTTTFHSLWMGVPVLALEGNTALSKVGAAIMSGLGLQQFCCATKENYVNQAVYLAEQLPELARVRLALRSQMAVLTELLAKNVTHSLEAAFETCWRDYREVSLQKLKYEKYDQSTLI